MPDPTVPPASSPSAAPSPTVSSTVASAVSAVAAPVPGALPAGRDLAGRVALVVGGSRNMGAAFAEDLAARGATVVISYAGDGEAAAGTLARLDKHQLTAEAVRSDATVPAQVEALFGGVVARHGRLDIVVHVPGAVLRKPLSEVTDEDYDLVFDRNARSAFLTLRATARHVADGGRCVVLSTTLTSVMTGPYGVYSGAKAAVERMVLAAAKELGARGITVNAVAPGPVDDSFYRAAETPESMAAAALHSPRGRLGDPGDIAPVVGFLVGAGGGWVSGQTVRANGAMF